MGDTKKEVLGIIDKRIAAYSDDRNAAFKDDKMVKYAALGMLIAELNVLKFEIESL